MKSIMVVEDDQPIVEMMELMLRRLGFESRMNLDGSAALADVKRDPPSLILLDIMMTPMNGWEFLERLRADPATKNLPVLLFTAHPSVESKVAGMKDQNLGILLKPVTLPELEKAIRRFLPPERTEHS